MLIGPGGQPLPEEIEQALRRQQEHAEMHAEARGHEMLRFFEELTEDQLSQLRSILSACAVDDTGRYASHLEGFVNGVLQWKHGVCLGCGSKHTDASDLIKETVPGGTLGKKEVDELNRVTDDGTEQLELSFEETAAQEQDRMSLMMGYSVREPNQRDFQQGLIKMPDEKPVICEGCGMLYQSLEDRMLRAPGVDGCQGCQHKAAHG